jgi:hypothetical protein
MKSTRFLPPNPLAEKVSRLPDESWEKPRDQAARAIDDAKTPLFAKLEEEVERLQSAFSALMEDAGDPGDHLKALNAISFELKGLGSMFGYDLVSEIGEFIFHMTKPGHTATDDVLDVIGLQVDAIALVIRERRDGDGGERGRVLVASLEEAMQKVSAERGLT